MCREICRRKEYKFTRRYCGEYYSQGAKRCNSIKCGGVWMKYEGVWCPCCGFKLKSRRRDKKNLVVVRI